MRLIGLLLALILLGYVMETVMKTYLDTAVTAGDGSETRSDPQGTLERAEQAAERINQDLQERQRDLEAAGG